MSCSAELETTSMLDLQSSNLGPPPRPTPLACSSSTPQSSRGVRREKRAAVLDTSLSKALQMFEDIFQDLENVMHRAASFSQRVLAPIADFINELLSKLRDEFDHQLHEFVRDFKKRTWTEGLGTQ